MRISFKVGKSNSLSILRQLKIYGTRYKIEKIQKLTENFEKACWRSVRTAEERAYMQKYHFLKHCLNVINTYRQKGFYTLSSDKTSTSTDSNTLSQSIIDRYDPKQSRNCLNTAEELLACVTNVRQSKDSESNKEKQKSSSEVYISEKIKPIVNKIDMDAVSEEDIKKLKNVISKLKKEVNLVDRHGNGLDVTGYSRSELREMVKL